MEEIFDVPAPRHFEQTVEKIEIVQVVQTISSERLQHRTVEQLDDVAVPHVMNDIVEVVRLIPQERLLRTHKGAHCQLSWEKAVW